MTKPIFPFAEDQVTEFKSRPQGLEREIVAFANAKGGNLFIGLDDQGKQVGLRIDNRLRSEIITAIENCEPRPQFSMKECDGVINLRITEGTQKPYRAPEGFFLRIGASSRKLKRDEIIKFYIGENRLHFDTQVREEIFLPVESNIFSPGLFASFREHSRLEPTVDDLSLLRNLNLVKREEHEDRAANALPLLFSRSASVVFPQARVIFWEMQDRTTILDQRIITGDLFSQLSLSMALTRERLKKRFRIEQLQREEEGEFADFVLRELLVNALTHRDYFEHGAETQIKLFPDKLEISNPGKPLHGTEPQNLIGLSLRRNPLIAEVFHRAGLVERAGTGLIRVQQLLDQRKLRPLVIEAEGEFFIATLLREGAGHRRHAPPALNLRQQQTLDKTAVGSAISSAEYAKRYKISERLARKELASLLSRGLMRRQRKGRKIVYEKQVSKG